MKSLIAKLMTPILMIAWATYYFAQVSQQNPQSQLLIKPVFYMVCVLFVVITIKEVMVYRNEKAEGTENEHMKKITKGLKEMLILAAGTAMYFSLLKLVGFVILTPLFLFAAFLYLGATKRMAGILAVCLTAFVYVSFKILLAVPLPAGFLGL